MADIMSTLKGLLGDNAEDKIQNAMEALQKSGITDSTGGTKASAKESLEKVQEDINRDINVHNTSPDNGALSAEGLEFINQIRGIVNRISNTNDSRSELLRSLRPFMRPQRQQVIDRAIRLINIGRFSGLFGKR